MTKVLLILALTLSLAGSSLAADRCIVQRGKASWYHESQRTASGARFDPNAMTAAHRTLPLGTMVRVTNLRTHCCAVLRINDRGPYRGGRIIDVSRAAARELKMINSGVAMVTVEVLPRGSTIQ
jgi:rare lipoprotein A